MPDDIERECGPAADGGWRCAPYAACTHPGGCLLAGLADPPHPTCIDASTIGEAPGTSWVCGPGCPRPAGPDPARDARIDAYRDRERRRAARALDRYCELMFGGDLEPVARRTAGERFVEQVGDYVLARLGGTGVEFCGNRVEHQPHPWSDYGVPKRCDGVPQHNGDYGVVIDAYLAGAPDPCAGGRCPDPEAHAEGAHDL